jgi:hypothetical protein
MRVRNLSSCSLLFSYPINSLSSAGFAFQISFKPTTSIFIAMTLAQLLPSSLGEPKKPLKTQQVISLKSVQHCTIMHCWNHLFFFFFVNSNFPC